MIENNLVLIDEDQPDLFEKKLIQLNASFINQLVMNPLLNGVNSKSGTVLLNESDFRTSISYES